MGAVLLRITGVVNINASGLQPMLQASAMCDVRTLDTHSTGAYRRPSEYVSVRQNSEAAAQSAYSNLRGRQATERASVRETKAALCPDGQRCA